MQFESDRNMLGDVYGKTDNFLIIVIVKETVSSLTF